MEEHNANENSIHKIVNKLFSYISKDKEDIEKVLNETLQQSQNIFDLIAKYQKLFIKDETRSMDFYYDAADHLTGAYMYLSPIVSIVDTLISKQALKVYQLLKLESVNNKEKFTSASAERESDFAVADMKILFSIFEGFLDSCRMGIQTCRRRIVNTEEEFGLAR